MLKNQATECKKALTYSVNCCLPFFHYFHPHSASMPFFAFELLFSVNTRFSFVSVNPLAVLLDVIEGVRSVASHRCCLITIDFLCFSIYSLCDGVLFQDLIGEMSWNHENWARHEAIWRVERGFFVAVEGLIDFVDRSFNLATIFVKRELGSGWRTYTIYHRSQWIFYKAKGVPLTQSAFVKNPHYIILLGGFSSFVPMQFNASQP